MPGKMDSFQYIKRTENERLFARITVIRFCWKEPEMNWAEKNFHGKVYPFMNLAE
jgi:hypothetical protein